MSDVSISRFADDLPEGTLRFASELHVSLHSFYPIIYLRLGASDKAGSRKCLVTITLSEQEAVEAARVLIEAKDDLLAGKYSRTSKTAIFGHLFFAFNPEAGGLTMMCSKTSDYQPLFILGQDVMTDCAQWLLEAVRQVHNSGQPATIH
jgi:hypothetical protein